MQIFIYSSNFFTITLTCFLYPIPKYKHTKTQNYIVRPNIINICSEITKGKANILLCHKHTDMYLKWNRQKILRVPESYLWLNGIFFYTISNVQFLSRKTHMKWASLGERMTFYITHPYFNGWIPNILQIYGVSILPLLKYGLKSILFQK